MQHTNNILLELGKVPPQAIDLEEAVLGCILSDKDSIIAVIDILKPESFYKTSHQIIYNAIVDLVKKNFPCDLFSVSDHLRSSGQLEQSGGPLYLTNLTGKVMSSANIEYYAKIITQKYVQREIIRISTELQSLAFNDINDISELMDYAETNFMELSGVIHKKKPKSIGQIIDSVITTIEKVISGEIKLIGVPSGFTSLDRATGGFKKQELTIIACRPSVGKTALALQISKNASALGYPVGIFSCEMSEDELGIRALSGASGKSNTELINGKCEVKQLLSDSEDLIKLPLYIDDTPAITLIELKAKTRRLIIEHGIKMIIVDYLQIMSGEGQSREQEVSLLSRGLKSIAKSLDISVIALSQLNRRLETTSDKRPNLSDLRESGAIEQDADRVLFPHRPALYGQKSIIINNRDENTEGLMTLIIAKNRNGIANIEIVLRHNESLTNIYEEDEFKSNNPF